MQADTLPLVPTAPLLPSCPASEDAAAAAAAAKSLQSCPTLCDPMDGSPPGSHIPGILQARTLEWVAISFSNAWKWKMKVKSLSHVRLLATPWTAAYQASPSMDLPGKSTRVGCHCLLHFWRWGQCKIKKVDFAATYTWVWTPSSNICYLCDLASYVTSDSQFWHTYLAALLWR